MKKRMKFFIAIFVIGCFLAGASSKYGWCVDPNKPTITVYGFENKASSGYWHDAKWDIGTGLGEMLIEAIVATNRFNVVERLNVEDITFEQDLVTKGRVSQKTGAKTGKMIGAQYIVRGTLTEFDVREGGAGAGVDIKGIFVGLSHTVAHIAGTLRIFDATTGEVITSKRFERKVPTTGLSLGYYRGQIQGSLGGFKKTPLGKATQLAITDIVAIIVASVPLEVPQWTCSQCGTKASMAENFCPKCGAPCPTRDMDTCPSCGVDVLPGAKFCTSCGAQLKDVKCTKCNVLVPAGTKFCPQCGGKIDPANTK